MSRKKVSYFERIKEFYFYMGLGLLASGPAVLTATWREPWSPALMGIGLIIELTFLAGGFRLVIMGLPPEMKGGKK